MVDTVDLTGAASVEEVQSRIRAYATAHPERPWFTGRGWVYMTSYDGHTAWANSKALEAGGITRETPDPEHGVIVRDEKGEPTGALEELAARLVGRKVPPPADEERYAALKRRLDEAASYGLTSAQNAWTAAADLPAYERVAAEGGLKVRFYFALPMLEDIPPDELARYKEMRTRYPGPLMKFGAVKGFVDGVVEAKTAAMLEPYAGGGTGELNWTPADLDRTVALYDREGFQIFLHAIGDKAIRIALDAYERAARANGTSGRRHRVEHIEVPRRADIIPPAQILKTRVLLTVMGGRDTYRAGDF